MNSLTYFTLDRDVRQVRGSEVEALAAQISGGLVIAGDPGYEDARKVWNATVDRRPAAIARCLNESDVQAAVCFAAEHRMLLSVRSGGHHNAGNAVAEGGMMLDLSGMRAITIDAEKRTARVGGGALLGNYSGMNLNIEPAAVPQHRGAS